MLKNEYEKLVKTQVTESEYRSIEAIYMESSLDKVDFCKVHGIKWLVDFRLDQIKRYEKLIAELETFANREQTDGRNDHNDDSDRKAEKPIVDQYGDTNTIRAYNRRIMGLQQAITAGDVITILEQNR